MEVEIKLFWNLVTTYSIMFSAVGMGVSGPSVARAPLPLPPIGSS